MNAWPLVVGLSLLSLGCQGEERGDCKEGFVRKQGRWCVFDEAALGLVGSDETGGSTGSGGSTADSSGSSSSSSGSDAAGSADEEYVYDAPEPQVEFDLAEIEWAMEEAIRLVRWIDPAKVHAAYRTVELDGNEACPNYDEEHFEERNEYHWRDSCAVSSGGSFSGYAYTYDHGDHWNENETLHYPGRAYFRGSARVIDGRGNTFVGAGNSNYWERSSVWTDDKEFNQSMSGNFRFDSPEYAGTWLSRDLNVSISHSSTRWVDDGDHYGGAFSVYWNASISGLTDNLSAVRLEHIYMYSENVGSMCEIEPSGTIAVRDYAGNWYEAEFDGPKYYDAGIFPPDCDSCGRVYWRGELLGTVCPDFSLLVDWEERPWL